MWKFAYLSRKANPLLDEAESINFSDPDQRETSETLKIFSRGSEIGDIICSVLQYTFTDEQDEKLGLHTHKNKNKKNQQQQLCNYGDPCNEQVLVLYN
jgi:hypothetical protein